MQLNFFQFITTPETFPQTLQSCFLKITLNYLNVHWLTKR